MTRARILLADDHAAIVDRLRELLAEAFDVVGTAGDGLTLIAEAKRLRPDVIVADISMPGTDGLHALKAIQEDYPEAKVILLTSHTSKDLARAALAAGACGFVLKFRAPHELVEAIRTVLAGASYVSARLSG